MLHEVKVAALGDGVTGVLNAFNVKVGDTVAVDDLLVSINIDKADADVVAEFAGTIERIALPEGSSVKEGDLILTINTGAQATAAQPAATQQVIVPVVTNEPKTTVETPKPLPTALIVPTQPATTDEHRRVSPLARKKARELGVTIETIKADGRISLNDVIKAYADAHVQKQPLAVANTAVAYKPLPDFSKFGSVRREAMTGIQKATAENMVYAWTTTPHAWILEKVDITALEKVRNQYKDAVKAAGGSLTITALIAKAVARALRQFPTFNASVDMETKEIIYKDYVHVGIAVDTPRGLLVPVIRDCDKKSLLEIAKDLTELSTRTRDAKNKPDDMTGGTFTLSNVGGIGGSGILPIVNSPQAAILGVTASQMEAFWNGEAFEPRLMMQMTIGFDHRVINGADATRFLQAVKNMLEDPFTLSLY